LFFKASKPEQAGSTELLDPPFPLPIPLEFRRSSRARRLSLRVDQAGNRIVLVAPLSVSRTRALDFLSRYEGGVVRRENGVVTAPGAPEHLARRVTDFLKAEARREIALRTRAKAASLGKPVTAITIRDTKSRWGSCNSAGRIAFSWRLIMAPEFVLDYVVAHEVAHLAELNHGVRFWRLCASLTEADPKAARAWLKRHGPELHSYR
jgi:predicted metal-dependent hydrolase